MASGVSLKPSDAVTGGGQFDDVDVTITKCRFRYWDYNGRIPKPILALEVTYRHEAEETEFTQCYSAGETEHFIPSDDGRLAVPVGSRPGLSDTSNTILFLASLVNSGFPENKIGDDVSVLEGTRVHINNVPQPKRPGLSDEPGTKAKVLLVVTKIHGFPWDAKVTGAKKATAKASGAKAASAAPAPAAQAAPAPTDEIQSKSVDTVMAILAAKGGSVAKSAIAQEAFKLLAKDPARNAVVQLIYKDEFLGQDGAPWGFDGSTVSLSA